MRTKTEAHEPTVGGGEEEQPVSSTANAVPPGLLLTGEEEEEEQNAAKEEGQRQLVSPQQPASIMEGQLQPPERDQGKAWVEAVNDLVTI